MKRFFRNILTGALGSLARAILHKYKPQIIMVTGSVGKTSTKDAVIAAFSLYTNVRGSEKSFNSEIGVPLTIIGAKNPWENPFRWIEVITAALNLLVTHKPYPKLLVLEVGADRPGDLARILRIATPDAVVVTRLPDVPVHVEAYVSTTAVKDEEFTPAYALAAGAPLVLASDNEYALSTGKKTNARLITFGFTNTSDVSISAPSVYMEKGRVVGMEAHMVIEGKKYPLIVRGALGAHQLLAPAAALACAVSLGVPHEKALKGLSRYSPPAGRTRILEGMKNTVIVDDSYNSSPAALEEALTALFSFPAQGRRVAVLGDMLELGRYSLEEHEKAGQHASSVVDVLIAVGTRAKAIADSAEKNGLAEGQVFFATDSYDASRLLPTLIEQGDTVLIKGSQGMRMERVVEALLENPEDVKFLVRQEREWKRRI